MTRYHVRNGAPVRRCDGAMVRRDATEMCRLGYCCTVVEKKGMCHVSTSFPACGQAYFAGR